jgi:hypothetical protein
LSLDKGFTDLAAFFNFMDSRSPIRLEYFTARHTRN